MDDTTKQYTGSDITPSARHRWRLRLTARELWAFTIGTGYPPWLRSPGAGFGRGSGDDRARHLLAVGLAHGAAL